MPLVTKQLPDDPAQLKTLLLKERPTRKPLPSDLPRVRYVIELSEEERQCSCGSTLVEIGEDISEQVDIEKSGQTTIKLRRSWGRSGSWADETVVCPLFSSLLPAGGRITELGLIQVVADHRVEAFVDLPQLAVPTGLPEQPIGEGLPVIVQLTGGLARWVGRFDHLAGQILAHRVSGQAGAACRFPNRYALT